MEPVSELAMVIEVEESDDEEAELPISPILPSARAGKPEPNLLKMNAIKK